jgi:protein-tyrosine phosphatase
MIDIHTHVLPDMDDGASDLETTVAMLEMARDDGVTDIVATPHVSLQYPYDPVRRALNMERARGVCPSGIRLHLGYEMYLTRENVEALLHKPDAFTINGHDYVLLELPDPALPTSVECAVQVLLERGVRPVIAHPERNRGLQRDGTLAVRLVQIGCYLQLTAQSITGSFGPEARRSAKSLLTERMVHFVASDAHGIEHRRPLLSAAYGEIRRQHGEAAARLLFEENPRALLAGDRIRTFSAQQKTLFSFMFGRSHERSISAPEMP